MVLSKRKKCSHLRFVLSGIAGSQGQEATTTTTTAAAADGAVTTTTTAAPAAENAEETPVGGESLFVLKLVLKKHQCWKKML